MFSFAKRETARSIQCRRNGSSVIEKPHSAGTPWSLSQQLYTHYSCLEKQNESTEHTYDPASHHRFPCCPSLYIGNPTFLLLSFFFSFVGICVAAGKSKNQMGSMQRAVVIRGRGGGSCIGSSTNISMSTASNADNNGGGCLTEQDYIGISEISSYPSACLVARKEEGAMGLKDTELNLGLSLNTLSESPAGEDGSSRRNGGSKRMGRILTAKDLPDMVPSLGFRGSRRMHGQSADADSVQEVTSVPR